MWTPSFLETEKLVSLGDVKPRISLPHLFLVLIIFYLLSAAVKMFNLIYLDYVNPSVEEAVLSIPAVQNP